MSETIQKKYIPPVKLMRFVYALLSPEAAGIKLKAEKMSGISRIAFYRAWKHEAFRKWYADTCHQHLVANEAFVNSMLMVKIAAGNVPAIRTYYERQGKISTGVNVSVNNNIENNIFVTLQKKSDDELREIAGRTRTASLN